MTEQTESSTATDASTAQPAQPSSTEYVERSDVGVSLTVKLTRGTGTRDQDTLKAKVKAATLEDAREDMEELRGYLRALADDVRRIQPDPRGE